MAASSSLVRRRRLHTWLAVLPLLPALFVVRPAWEDDSLAAELLEICGYALVVMCVLGRTWCASYIAGAKKVRIVSTGPYSTVRNPLYLFSFFGVIGIGITSGMITVAAFLAIVFAAYYSIIVRREEAFLSERFGAAFEQYCRIVPRWLPQLSLWRDDGDRGVVIRRDLLLITMRDSALFFLAFPAFELLEQLHASGFIPADLRLP